MQPPDGPPICTALNSLPFRIPPPISKITSRSVFPIGISTSPPLLILPVSAKTFVPLLSSVPIAANASPPFARIHGTFANVSTLLILEGFCQYPFCAGKGGFKRGIPRCPSSDSIKAVSSPHTNAPAPALIRILQENPLPAIFSPRYPRSSAWRIAFVRRTIARGYSARTYTTASHAPIA